jgi:hypothetical protein
MVRKERPGRSVTSFATALALGALAACATPAPPPEGLRHSVVPYVWVPTLEGSATGDDGSSNDLGLVSFDNLDFFAMGLVELRSADELWATSFEALTVSFEQDSANASEEFDVSMFELALARRFEPRFAVEGLVGVRWIDVSAELDLLGVELIDSEVRAPDPFVGVRARVPMGPRFGLAGRVDVGGTGDEIERSFQVIVDLQVALSARGTLTVGYRRFEADLDDDSLDFTLAGPMVAFRWLF